MLVILPRTWRTDSSRPDISMMDRIIPSKGIYTLVPETEKYVRSKRVFADMIKNLD